MSLWEETCREHPRQNGALEESDLWPKSEDLPFFFAMKVEWKRGISNQDSKASSSSYGYGRVSAQNR